jgi:hypothetical protein
MTDTTSDIVEDELDILSNGEVFKYGVTDLLNIFKWCEQT